MSLTETLVLATAFVLAPVCAGGATLSTSRAASLFALLGVYLSAGALLWILQEPRIGLSLAVAGVACTGILANGLGRAGWPAKPAGGDGPPRGRAFRLAAILLFGTSAWGLSAPFVGAIPGESPTRVTCALVVLAIGLLQLGLSQEQGSAGIGLLTTLVGFEILYAGLEPALAVRAVLAGIMVGISLVTSILVQQPSLEPAQDRRLP